VKKQTNKQTKNRGKGEARNTEVGTNEQMTNSFQLCERDFFMLTNNTELDERGMPSQELAHSKQTTTTA